jgi:succinate dehydrogenase / fumarate reductase cytochrome b subunit
VAVLNKQAPTRALPALTRSSVGKKAIMAVTGTILVLFLLAHMAGNLKVFLGADDFNHYAGWLRTMGEPALPRRWLLSGLEIVLTVAVVLHMWSAISLARAASKARPVKYAARKKSYANGYATHTMRYGGVIIVLFVIWHLLDLTFGAVNPEGGDATAYDKVVADFDASRWYITLFYVLAVVMVGLHLRHGIASAAQTLGFGNKKRYGALDLIAAAVAALITIGFLAVPLSVTFGWVS